MVITEVLEHLVQPQSFIEAAAKLLVPDGRLVVTVPFGINDFIDHKHTFYLLEPFRLINEYFEIKDIKVLGKWLGIVGSLRVSSKSKSVSVGLAEKQIEQLESAFFQIERNLRDDLVVTRKKLEEANQKYRVVTEQLTAHKQLVAKEEATRIAVEAKLQQTSAQMTQAQGRLDEANKKYRDATEQVSMLKQRVAQEETARGESLRALEQGQQQFLETKASLQKECGSLQNQIEQLQSQGHDSSAALHEAEKQLIGLQARFEASQVRLDEANKKHLAVTEQVTVLESRVVQEQEARNALQKQIEQLQAQGQGSSNAFHEAEKQLIGLRAKYEASQERLNEANKKHQDVLEKVGALNQEVTKEEAARVEAVKALEQSREQLAAAKASQQEECSALKQQIEQLQVREQGRNAAFHEAEKQLIELQAKSEVSQERLDDANWKYRNATEQVSTLKQRVANEQDARGALQQQIEQLQNKWQGSREALHEAEKQLIRLQARFEAIQERLNEANGKYQNATEQVGTLKQRVAQEETARGETIKALEQSQQELAAVKASLQVERSSLQQKIEQLQVQGQEISAAFHAAEKELIGLQARFEAEQDLLHVANAKNRDAAEQVSLLTQRIAHEEATVVETSNALEQSRRQVIAVEAMLQEERGALQTRIAELTEQDRVSSDAAAEAKNELVLQARQLDAVIVQLESANQKYRFATEQSGRLRQQLSRQDDARRAAEKLVKQTTVQLEEANLKYRKITSDVVPDLKGKLEEQYVIKREQQHALEQLKIEVKKSKRALSEAHDKLQKIQQQKLAADQQVIKTRASLSFQLGYLLIHHFKSFKGLISLPSALWTWRKEVLKRRAKKNQLSKALEVVVPKSSGLVAVEAKLAIPEKQEPVAVQFLPVLSEQVLTHREKPVKKTQRLKVACIMDEFTFGSYEPECTTQQLTPNHWKAELEEFQPELLFIESAWRGKDELWGSKVGHTSQELQGIVAWCRTKNVPTVFWNKEDPVHFETFLTTAKLFDHVFTTDIDCIHRYKAALGHEQVYLLPFACQPANNNPIETYERKDAFCFAGAYYVKYPERTRDLGNFVEALPAFRPLEIYDRNFGKNDPNYQFPAEYQPYIVGTLPFDQIDKAYKGYRYAINLNSIKQSQTMFARRVFELLASNTVTVSNFSRGVRLLFGDLVITTDSGDNMVRRLSKIANDETHSRKLRLAALRKVMQEHTYTQRMAYVVSKATGQTPQRTLPTIAVVALVVSQAELNSVLNHYLRQSYAHRSLLIVAEGFEPLKPVAAADVHLVLASEINGQTLHTTLGEVDWVAAMIPQDYYGPHYLLDIALATRYSRADVIGKAAYFMCTNGALGLRHADAAYRPATALPARSAALRLQLVAGTLLMEWLYGLTTRQVGTNNGLSIDEFNYCRNGGDSTLHDEVSACVDDLPGLNTGIGIDELLMRAEAIAPAVTDHDGSTALTGKQLAADFGKAPSAAIKLEVEYDHWRIESALPDGKHEYLYATTQHSLESLGVSNQLKFYFDITPGLNIQLVIVFLDAQRQKISHAIKHSNRNQEVDIPVGSAFIRFGLRFYAGGSAEIKELVLGHRNLQPAEMLGKAEHLILTNHYPSYEDLYRNGFVHSRVRAYREHGVRCDVFRLRPKEAVSFHEFEDVDVTTGSQEVLHKMLCSGQYKSVLVHFLDPAMWEVLQHHVDRIKVVVWVHGAEIQPWHRRDFNNENEDQRTVAKMKSDKRMEFWRELLLEIPSNLKLVFVSRSFAEDVMEDLGFRIPEGQYAIIHNPINTELFGYQEKPVEQRKKVLSIRPYASKVYANDLMVKAILQLSKKPFFYDLEFRLIGDGQLFEETLEPLRQFSNVYIEQRFLTQSEIALLHKEYGIFLCPSRMDTQGVSRDEAMSSGLVPITNSVAAIPEFVDESCGILAGAEDHLDLANGVCRLYENSDLFTVMSRNGAELIRKSRSARDIIAAEIYMFN
ncbi:hypothetical protein P245_12325 [Comamonas thiooxydans]|uniref:Spore protein YkvP/CgeB glycosyl transferase-like domain-containing protein n=1 Tax=Comamonas thiooxydans TaxID=363952 RepID=A0A0E3C2G4_9BURK|nr:hypothetical protein P245_12325 [Comamonas thiooxydans]